METNTCVLTGCGRLIANDVINAFKKGAWKHNVVLTVYKIKPGWLSTSIDIRFSWTGEKANVNSYTIAAKTYINKISSL